MITTEQEFSATVDRLTRFQAQANHLRKTETNPSNYKLAVAGFLTEIDRMHLAVREYLITHPKDLAKGGS